MEEQLRAAIRTAHYSIRTTEIYTRLARTMRRDIRSPLDDL